MNQGDLDIFIRGSMALCLAMVVFNALRYRQRKLRSILLGGAFALLALELALYRIDTAWSVLALVGVLIFGILVLDFVMHASTIPPPKGDLK